MNAILQPVLIRFLAYVLSSLVLAVPASWAGVIMFNAQTDTFSLSLSTLAMLISGAIVTSGAIVGKWGTIVPASAIRGLVLRVLLYSVAPALALIPSSWAGVVSFDPTTQMINVTIAGLVGATLIALGGSGMIFAKWGIK